MAKFSKTDPGTLPHLRWNSLQQLVKEESCKVLHLICDKVLGSAPDFYVSHHYMRSILTANLNMKNKKSLINVEPGVYYKGFGNFTSVVFTCYKDFDFSITTTKIIFLTR